MDASLRVAAYACGACGESAVAEELPGLCDACGAEFWRGAPATLYYVDGAAPRDLDPRPPGQAAVVQQVGRHQHAG